MNITMQDVMLQLDDIEKAKKEVVTLKPALEQNAQALKKARLQLQKEQEDVEQLEHLSFSYIKAMLTNTKEEQLSKEQEELAQAHITFKHYEIKDEVLRAQYRKLQVLLSSQEALQHKLEELQREEAMQKHPLACIDVDQKIMDNRRKQHELQETLDCIRHISRRLDVVLHHFDDTFTFDMLIEQGGFLTTAAKHNKLYALQDEIEHIRLDVMRLKKEFMQIQTHDLSNIDLPLDLIRADFSDNFFVHLVQGHVCVSPEMSIRKRMRDSIQGIQNFQKEIQKRDKVILMLMKENNLAYENLKDRYEDIRRKDDMEHGKTN